jgi:uncharacterized SAM-binding protein YcdF (DUF218 family)
MFIFPFDHCRAVGRLVSLGHGKGRCHVETREVKFIQKSSSIPWGIHIQKCLTFSILLFAIIYGMIRVLVPLLEGFLVVDIPLAHADAIVVMAGEMPIRLPAAASLYKEGKAPKILLTNDGIFSSWSEEKQRNLYQVEWAEENLFKFQIPENAIVNLSYTSSGSIHDALNTRKYVLDKRLKSIIIVTSDYHTRRSLWTFERVFQGYHVKVGVFPARSAEKSSYLSRFMTLSYEMLKLVYYKCRYNPWVTC